MGGTNIMAKITLQPALPLPAISDKLLHYILENNNNLDTETQEGAADFLLVKQASYLCFKVVPRMK